MPDMPQDPIMAGLQPEAEDDDDDEYQPTHSFVDESLVGSGTPTEGDDEE